MTGQHRLDADAVVPLARQQHEAPKVPQHLDARASVELLTEIIGTAIRDWKNPAPPSSLAALRNAITDRIAGRLRAEPGSRRPPMRC